MGRIRTVGQLGLNTTPNQLESHLGCTLPIIIDSKIHVSKTQFASMIDVDRTIVIVLEKVKRLPSLEYIYKFSKIFNFPIDYLIETTLK